MKIALIHYRLLHAGGLENRIRNYANWFAQNGHEVDIICNRHDPSFPIPQNVNVVRIKKWPLPKVFKMWAFDQALGRYMKRKKYDFSLGMGRTSHHLAVLAPGNHLGYLRAIGKQPFGLSDALQIKMDHKGHDHSKIIFSASEMMRKELIELYGVNPEKVKVLYPPLDTEQFKFISAHEKAQAKQKAGIDNDTRVFVFVSGSHARKGLAMLLKIFESLVNEKIVLLVAGGKKIESNLPNVRYLGFLENPMDVYRLADVLVHPAVYEPFGQIVSEAVACGIPVFISDRTGAAEVVSSKEGKVLPYNDFSAWKKAIKDCKIAEFSISENWPRENELDVDSHMRKMLHFAGFKPK